MKIIVAHWWLILFCAVLPAGCGKGPDFASDPDVLAYDAYVQTKKDCDRKLADVYLDPQMAKASLAKASIRLEAHNPYVYIGTDQQLGDAILAYQTAKLDELRIEFHNQGRLFKTSPGAIPFRGHAAVLAADCSS